MTCECTYWGINSLILFLHQCEEPCTLFPVQRHSSGKEQVRQEGLLRAVLCLFLRNLHVIQTEVFNDSMMLMHCPSPHQDHSKKVFIPGCGNNNTEHFVTHRLVFLLAYLTLDELAWGQVVMNAWRCARTNSEQK